MCGVRAGGKSENPPCCLGSSTLCKQAECKSARAARGMHGAQCEWILCAFRVWLHNNCVSKTIVSCHGVLRVWELLWYLLSARASQSLFAHLSLFRLHRVYNLCTIFTPMPGNACDAGWKRISDAMGARKVPMSSMACSIYGAASLFDWLTWKIVITLASPMNRAHMMMAVFFGMPGAIWFRWSARGQRMTEPGGPYGADWFMVMGLLRAQLTHQSREWFPRMQ